jgi:hypothetical protein
VNHLSPVFNGTNSPGAVNGQGTIHFGSINSPTNGTGLKTRDLFGITGSAPRSMFVVLRHDSDRSMNVRMGDISADGSLFAVGANRDRFYLPGGWNRDNNVTMTSTNWNLLEVTYDGTSQRGYINGILRGVANFQLSTVKKEFEIGYRAASNGQNSQAADGDFAELLVYDRALNDSERKEVENYLTGKWFGKKSSGPRGQPIWYDTGMGGLTGLSYSKETGGLLFGRTESGMDSVWQLNTASRNAIPTQVMQGQSVRNAQWAGPDSFVYSSRLDTRASINLAYLSGKESKQLLQLWANGAFDWFKLTPDNKQLFLLGNISNAPVAGIWRRDLESNAWHPVISTSDHPSSQNVVATHNRMALASGQQVTLTIYRPANFDPHKKYPLVLGDTVITDAIYGEPFMTSMAACGATVAVVERPYWGGGLEQWAQNVQAAFDQIKTDPSVDTKRVYLFAASAETQYLSQLVEPNPAPWRGLIFLNPSRLPDFSKSPLLQVRPRILLDAGGEEHQEEHFKKYQRDVLAYGVVVECFTHPGETHRMVGSASKLERARILKHFIFEE